MPDGQLLSIGLLDNPSMKYVGLYQFYGERACGDDAEGRGPASKDGAVHHG